MDESITGIKSHEMGIKKEATTERVIGSQFEVVSFTREGNDYEGKKNEDSIKYKIITLEDGSEIAVVVIGDGVGAKKSPHSKVGADIVTEEALAIIEKNADAVVKRIRPKTKPDKGLGRYIDRTILIPTKRNWVKRVQAVSEEETPDLMKYASTLMIGIVTDDYTGIIRMGDNNAYLARDDNKVVKVFFPSEEKKDGKNATVTIAHPNPNLKTEFTSIRHDDNAPGILFSSDGLEETTPDQPVSEAELDKLLRDIFQTEHPESLKMLVPQKKDDVSFVRVLPLKQPAEEIADKSDKIVVA